MERSRRSTSNKIGNAFMVAASALTLGACGNNLDLKRIKKLEQKTADQAALISRMGKEQEDLAWALDHFANEVEQRVFSKPTPAQTDSHKECLTGLAKERKTNDSQALILEKHNSTIEHIAKRLDAISMNESK